jgi:hypothetical protein
MDSTDRLWKSKLFYLTFLALLLASGLKVNAQAREGNDFSTNKSKKTGFRLDPDRIIVGGNIGAQFGDITYVELSPTVGYLITENWLGGLGGRYIYYEEKYAFTSFNTNIYGGGIFSQYYFLENFIAHAEYELLNLNDFNYPEKRTNVSSIFVGGGYRSMIGNSSFGSILLLYNLNDDINSPYTNPVLRISFGIGL